MTPQQRINAKFCRNDHTGLSEKVLSRDGPGRVGVDKLFSIGKRWSIFVFNEM